MAAPTKEKMKLITPVFRGSYVNAVKPRAIEEGGDPVFSMMMVLLKKDPETKAFMAKLEAAVSEACINKLGKDILPHTKLKHWFVQDGDTSDNEEHAGAWTFRASSKFRPGAIDHKTRNPLFEEEDLYSGAWYRASLDAWCWSNAFGTGCSLNLNNIMKMKDDAKFGGGAKPEQDFEAFLDEAGGADAAADMGLD